MAIMPGTISGKRNHYGYHERNPRRTSERLPKTRRPAWTKRSAPAIIKNRSLFPNDEADFKLLYLALKNIEKKWTMPIRKWEQALQQFAIVFEGRMPLP